ncbi:hypothetical protein [Amantichitinum ursilacus]|uniref:Uncharacterized protein n=1 Tax=Amantichitinum ursilacus TaxID=857265 RepID=A0A0N0XKV3_9NEIS|nr:hypothetical protein [Amantichitinum ursilacus]KPC53158.1 hypothetical protein WG78_08710 [Amantichitinum ursilacus]
MATAEYKSVPHSTPNSRIIGIEQSSDNPEIRKLIFNYDDLLRAGFEDDIAIHASLLNGSIILIPLRTDTGNFDVVTGKPV